MKKSLKRFLSVILAVLIVILSAAPGAYAAASYPTGVTKEQALSAIDKTDTLLYTLLKQTQNKTLKQLVLPMLYSSDSLSALTVGIYKAIEESGEDLSALGLDLSPYSVASYLSQYPQVATRVAQYGTWSDVNLEGVNWGVNDKTSFCYAAGAIFSPFNELLYALLCGGSYSVNALIGIKGAKGFDTVIVPTLVYLGCESIVDSDTFYRDAAADKNTMVSHIIYDVMTLLEKVLDAPCDTLTDILPGIAIFLTQGGFDSAVSTLIEPLRVQILSIPILKVDSLLEGISDGGSFSINFNDLLGGTGIKTGELDLEGLASCGTVTNGEVVSDKADTFIYLLRFAIDTLKLNPDLLSSAEGMEETEDMLSGLMSKSTDEIVKMFFDLVCATQAQVNDYQWIFPAFTAVAGEYTANLGADKYQRVADGIDELINEFVAEGGEYETLGEMLKYEIYSNTLVSELVCGLYGLFSGEDMEALSMFIDLPATPSALASVLDKNSLYSTRLALYEYRSFSSIDTSKLTWGFKDGDREGFIKAVSAALSPLNDVLNMLLCEGKLQVLGCVDLYGSNGYNTAVIPLLEALGCSSDTIKSYDEYRLLAAEGKGLETIIGTLCSLIDRILEKPIYTLLDILPNLMYNINGGLLDTAISNLLYPFRDIMNSLGGDTSSLIDFGNMDISSLMGGMTEDIGMSIDLSKLDLKKFGSYGTATTVQSKRTSGGQDVSITYIQADKPAEVVAILRFFVEIMKQPGNEDLLMGFMSGSGEGGGNDMFATFSGGVIEDLAAMTTDETVEWLYKLFFRERAVVQETPETDYLPTVIYVPEKESNALVIILILLLLVSMSEVVLIKKRDRIESYLELKKLKQEVSAQEIKQEV